MRDDSQPALANRYLKRLLPPWISRLMDRILNCLQPSMRIHEAQQFQHHIDSVPFSLADRGEAILSGWCFAIETGAMPPLRVRTFSLRGAGLINDYRAINRSDVIQAFPECHVARSVGCLFVFRPAPWLNHIRLEAKLGEKWIPLLDRRFRREWTDASPIGRGRKREFRKESNPLVSVVIPCYNYGKYLSEAIDSVLQQTWRNVEIIVVDDGSDASETIDILNGLKKTRTTVIRQKNGKLPKARNTGIRAAKGKFICCLDADDKLRPTYLEKCVRRMENDGLDICGSLQQNFGDNESILDPGPFRLQRLFRENCLIVSSVFSRSLWEQIGGYDESMIHGFEDWEFWLRAAKAGARAATIKEPLFLYRKHGPSMIDSSMARREEILSYIHKKHAVSRTED